MKKLLVSVIALLFAITIVRAQDTWGTYRIDGRVSVNFPKQPKEISPDCFLSFDKDSTVYFSLALDMNIPDVDSMHIDEYYHTPEATGLLKQLITKGFPDSDVGDLKIGTWKGLTSFTTSGINTSTKAKIDVFIFLMANGKIYLQFVAVRSGKATTGRDQFFSSLTLTN